jgi:3-hydroxyisobutyrate dehydrogenase-like beta-hydroxyacid dehydrogenase
MAVSLPSPIIQRIGFVGYGAVGKALASALKSQGSKGVTWVGAWDFLFDEMRDLPDEEMEHAEAVAKFERQHARDRGIAAAGSMKQLCETSTLVISCVTASQTLEAAKEAAMHLQRGTYFLDLNTAHPDAQLAASALITAAGGHFVSGELMSIPINSESATRLAAALAPVGFVAA